jgi:hypothetical protein
MFLLYRERHRGTKSKSHSSGLDVDLSKGILPQLCQWRKAKWEMRRHHRALIFHVRKVEKLRMDREGERLRSGRKKLLDDSA